MASGTRGGAVLGKDSKRSHRGTLPKFRQRGGNHLSDDKEFLRTLIDSVDPSWNLGPEIHNDATNAIRYIKRRNKFWKQKIPGHILEKTMTLESIAPHKPIEEIIVEESAEAILYKFVLRQLIRVNEGMKNGNYAMTIETAKSLIATVNSAPMGTLPGAFNVLANCYSIIGNCYLEMGDTKKALSFHMLDMKLATSVDMPEAKARALDNVGRVYVKKGEYAKAISVWEQKVPMEMTTEERVWLYHELGYCHLELEQYDEAKLWGEEALRLATKIENQNWQLNASVMVAQAALRSGCAAEASEAFHRARDIAILKGDDEAKLNITEAIEEVNEAIVAMIHAAREEERDEERSGKNPAAANEQLCQVLNPDAGTSDSHPAKPDVGTSDSPPVKPDAGTSDSPPVKPDVTSLANAHGIAPPDPATKAVRDEDETELKASADVSPDAQIQLQPPFSDEVITENAARPASDGGQEIAREDEQRSAVFKPAELLAKSSPATAAAQFPPALPSSGKHAGNADQTEHWSDGTPPILVSVNADHFARGAFPPKVSGDTAEADDDDDDTAMGTANKEAAMSAADATVNCLSNTEECECDCPDNCDSGLVNTIRQKSEPDSSVSLGGQNAVGETNTDLHNSISNETSQIDSQINVSVTIVSDNANGDNRAQTHQTNDGDSLTAAMTNTDDAQLSEQHSIICGADDAIEVNQQMIMETNEGVKTLNDHHASEVANSISETKRSAPGSDVVEAGDCEDAGRAETETILAAGDENHRIKETVADAEEKAAEMGLDTSPEATLQGDNKVDDKKKVKVRVRVPSYQWKSLSTSRFVRSIKEGNSCYSEGGELPPFKV